MSWLERINPDSGVWHGVTEYANERIQELTAICVSSHSTDTEIRQAQAGIDELQRLIKLPSRMAVTAQQMARPKQTTGY